MGMIDEEHLTNGSDFREFLFRATGRETNPDGMAFVDVYDNMMAELDRMAALAELLEDSQNPIEPKTRGGIAALLKDVEQRMRTVLEHSRRDPHRRVVERGRKPPA